MLPIETGQKVDKKSISSSFDDGLNDHRSHIDDGRSGGVEESSRFVPNKSQATPYRGNSHPTNADGNAQSGKPINRRRSSVGRSRAASFSKMSSSVGKKIAHKNSVFREDENVVRSSENTMHHLTSNGANEFKDANTRERAESRVSYTSEADSTGSRSSQETEEDVCFPMEREQVKLNGIDFGVINEFIREERQDNNSKHEEPIVRSFSIDDANPRYATSNTTGAPYRFQKSLAASKYTPMRALKSMFQRPKEERRTSSTGLSHLGQDERKIDFNSDDSFSEAEVKFGGACVTDGTSGGALPNRFSFFHSESEETVHAPDIPSLVPNGESIQELFHNGEKTWWLDCTCPTDAEMKMLAKAFGIHPLTAEDIRMQETREKVELFKSYYFVCFHTFESDKESEDYLEPINVYIVVFRDGILTFHFSPLTHPANVRRRVRQLRDYVDVTADWLCYAMIDDITDSFAPAIQGIEYEADAIEDAVFTARDTVFSNMLQRIGESRRKVMTLMRLLSGKADVIKMFAKRCQDEAALGYRGAQWGFNQDNVASQSANISSPHSSQEAAEEKPGPSSSNHYQQWQQKVVKNARPRADIALYLGDIQDHIITMFQNLLAYEKIFSRSHSNYLAQLQVESLGENNKITQMFSKVTIIGTMLIPLNLVTGLFGMNVTVPGQDSSIAWFFGILGVLLALLGLSVVAANWWLERVNKRINNEPRPVFSARKSFKSLRMKDIGNRSINSFV